MANEAFALSPMSARAAEPNEQDYDAIREAFMETARGRWFLGEYAKRNRNADTSMVLDAVAKIEETLAAQRQPVVEDRLPEALVEIRRAIREAETIAIAAFDPAAIEASLAPIPRGVRIIKEISWRWREIGADGRICDLIDSQLASIEAACGQVSTLDPRTELKAAFDLLRDRVEQLDADGDATPQATAARSSAAPVQEAQPSVAEASPLEAAPAAMASETAVAFTETPQDITVAAEPEAAAETAGDAEAFAIAEQAMDAAVEPEIAAESPIALEDAAPEDAAFEEPAFAEVADEFSLDAAAEAEDEAVLAAIALEMAAPDPDFDEIIEPVEMAAAIPEPMIAEVAAPIAAVLREPAAPEPAAAPIVEAHAGEAPIAMESLARLTNAIAEAAAEVMEQPAPAMAATASFAAAPTAPLPMPSPLSASLSESSLGATILASGILQKPRAAANDPLAPIRRMTQAEKIAFFS
ncbi:hypothetical protein JOE51_005323 [Bradyrhizobium japonicum]|uniref:Uncharacterized protein n=1 Tax=Bradyrhizobium diazoefficiens TaxID=1355477 RepID=A0A809YTA4_9BRAD|nr:MULTISPECIES: hypothetical protein [Bradyrhizobium]MBP1063856.1 hypothetical protein [Bradyrhizobium japonicum]MDA9535977.1 hypothetical protein [Bradyrhizobium sp. CCBAU 21362]BCA05746.1 hypothetical protein H12S4_66500 [Bradyrhizobium diazoefficiens]BCA23100.1 hypothetical protein BDHH15_63150 [Bradyrhizobium diazoefficiens]BCE32473.1 hypothetical protein XF2B_62420 [Bradyrhizobium diazoefficiens]